MNSPVLLADMGLPALAIICVVAFIVLGSSLQVVTGIGLGLIAGPALLFFLDSISAIQVAIVLNLLLTFCLLFADRKHVSSTWLLSLSVWAVIGIPCGFALIVSIDQGVLKIVGALFILAALLQLKYFPTAQVQLAAPTIRMRVAGYFSGVLTGALAAPGPLALWALLSHGASALTARATIRYYFAIVYSVALVLHLSYAGVGERVMALLFVLVPAMFVGMACGLIIRRFVTQAALMKLLDLVLIAMGVSLLIKGVIDVA